MTENNVNVPLLRKAVEWAEAEAAKPVDQSHWNQMDWVSERACGTAYCIAGYVAQLQDERLVSQSTIYDEDGKYLSSRLVAMEALGLTPPQAGVLFWGANSIEDVRRIAEDLAGEPL